MLLSVAERILIGSVLPAAEGDYLFLRSIRAFREALSFSDEEALEAGVTRTAKAVSWNPDATVTKEIQIGPIVAKYVSDSIKAARSLREEHLAVYSRFVVEE